MLIPHGICGECQFLIILFFKVIGLIKISVANLSRNTDFSLISY